MATESERKVLEAYSTPGLRRNELTPTGKKDHLAGLGISGQSAKDTLEKLYGPDAEKCEEKQS